MKWIRLGLDPFQRLRCLNPFIETLKREFIAPVCRSGRSPRFPSFSRSSSPTVYDIGIDPIATRRRRRRDWGWEAAMARSRRWRARGTRRRTKGPRNLVCFLTDRSFIFLLVYWRRKPAGIEQEGHDHPGLLFSSVTKLLGFKGSGTQQTRWLEARIGIHRAHC
ncbi:hypothetical protein B296_00011395 [Ensete ventricosum]|uniref:Uncharacterized protein n=1 Tax=Ensete ventricosum TaxID=4639 RepID=A0A427AYA0_ENSVE|nr:hypothetical protein B296_00011395 [Ensete ventricosum]